MDSWPKIYSFVCISTHPLLCNLTKEELFQFEDPCQHHNLLNENNKTKCILFKDKIHKYVQEFIFTRAQADVLLLLLLFCEPKRPKFHNCFMSIRVDNLIN